MDVYTVIKEFSAPQISQHLYVGDSVGKLASRVSTLINGTEYDCSALYNWICINDCPDFLTFVGTVPDPDPSGAITEEHGMVALTAGQDFFTLAGAAWGFVPTAMVAVVVKPGALDDNLFLTLRDGTLTADGFTVDLSSDVPGAGYKLSYFVIL